MDECLAPFRVYRGSNKARLHRITSQSCHHIIRSNYIGELSQSLAVFRRALINMFEAGGLRYDK
jgi:hypothetical protein